jgi:protein involved in polysaccharide export with SLBB domain
MRFRQHFGRFAVALFAFVGTATTVPAQTLGGDQQGVQRQGRSDAPSMGATTPVSGLPYTTNLTLPPGGQAAMPPGLPGQPNMPLAPSESTAIPYVPGEFEMYVQGLAKPQDVRRLGANLVVPGPDAAANGSPLVPADYVIVPGDELALAIWGSVDADLRVLVDRSGRITIPRVGPVLVAGVRYADLPGVISKRIARQFKNFELSVSLAQLRAIRVFVTGYVGKPGAHSLASLSTISSAVIKAGGPTAAGSFREARLMRGGKLVSTFDFYDLLVSGNRDADTILQPDDVVHVGPVGPQVAIIGSVNQPAVIELKRGDALQSALEMAGGLSAVADSTRATIEPLSERGGVRVVELKLPDGARTPLHAGDVVRVFSSVDAKLPLAQQNRRVIVEGEVARPGTYVLPANSSISSALAAAGGLTNGAYLFGTQFTRVSVKQTQQQNYDRALRDLEADLTKSASTRRAASAEEAASIGARATATTHLIEVLRAATPDGRVVLQLDPNAASLPDLALEDGDRIFVPGRPSSVGVFGSVFNGGNFLQSQGHNIDDFIQLAGGPTRGADKNSAFVIRANGSVVSNLQANSWFGSERLTSLPALAGDTVFVPEEMDKTTFVQHAKDWTQILYQFGIGAAALQTLK